MPKKCDSCRFHGGSISGEICVRLELPELLEAAREICDKEGDGIFVYFEPITPAAGATFEAPKTMAASA